MNEKEKGKEEGKGRRIAIGNRTSTTQQPTIPASNSPDNGPKPQNIGSPQDIKTLSHAAKTLKTAIKALTSHAPWARTHPTISQLAQMLEQQLLPLSTQLILYTKKLKPLLSAHDMENINSSNLSQHLLDSVRYLGQLKTLYEKLQQYLLEAYTPCEHTLSRNLTTELLKRTGSSGHVELQEAMRQGIPDLIYYYSAVVHAQEINPIHLSGQMADRLINFMTKNKKTWLPYQWADWQEALTQKTQTDQKTQETSTKRPQRVRRSIKNVISLENNPVISLDEALSNLNKLPTTVLYQPVITLAREVREVKEKALEYYPKACEALLNLKIEITLLESTPAFLEKTNFIEASSGYADDRARTDARKTEIKNECYKQLCFYQQVADTLRCCLMQLELSSDNKILLFPFLVEAGLNDPHFVDDLTSDVLLRRTALKQAFQKKQDIPHCAYPTETQSNLFSTLYSMLTPSTLYALFESVVTRGLALVQQLHDQAPLNPPALQVADYKDLLLACYNRQFAQHLRHVLSEHANRRELQETALTTILQAHQTILTTYDISTDKIEPVDLRDVPLQTGLKVTGLDFSSCQLTVEQVWPMLGFSTCQGLPNDLIQAARVRKQIWATHLLNKQVTIIEHAVEATLALDDLLKLAGDEQSSSLTDLPEQQKRLLAINVLLTTILNILPDDHPQSLITIEAQEGDVFWQCSTAELMQGLEVVIGLHEPRLTALQLYAACSIRAERCGIDVGDTTLWLSDVEKTLPDLTDTNELVETLKEARKKQKEAKEMIAMYFERAEQRYFDTLLAYLNDAAASKEKRQDALKAIVWFAEEVQRSFVLNLRNSHLEDLSFNEIAVPKHTPWLVSSTMFEQLPTSWKLAGVAKLNQAIEQGDQKTVEACLAAGVDVNQTNVAGRTPLDIACRVGPLPIVECLLDAGANPQYPSVNHLGPLDALCFFDEPSAQALITLCKKYTSLTLHQAAALGDIAQIHELLAQRADVNHRHPYHQLTPLHIATQTGQQQAVAVLLKAKADVSLEDYSGCTAFDIACLANNAGLASLLWTGSISLIKPKQAGLSLVQWAATQNRKEIVKLLLSLGAPKGIYEAICIADYDYLSGFLDTKEPYQDAEGNTLLHLAIQMKQIPVALWLIKNNIPLWQKNYQDSYPLPLAAHHGLMDVVKILIEKGAPLDHEDYIASPLLEAVEEKHESITLFLLQQGANTNARHKFLGYSVIQKAVRLAQRPIIEMLLRKGALFTVDKNGDTLLHEAAQTQDVELLRWLTGTMLSFRNKAGKTAVGLLHHGLKPSAYPIKIENPADIESVYQQPSSFRHQPFGAFFSFTPESSALPTVGQRIASYLDHRSKQAMACVSHDFCSFFKHHKEIQSETVHLGLLRNNLDI